VKDLVCFRDFFDINNLHHHNEVFELLLTFSEHDGTSNIDNGRKEGCHRFSFGTFAFSLQLTMCKQDWTSSHGLLFALG
jgi:hypothetical protein